MPDRMLEQLPLLPSLSGPELLYVVQGAADYRTTADQLREFSQSSAGISPIKLKPEQFKPNAGDGSDDTQCMIDLAAAASAAKSCYVEFGPNKPYNVWPNNASAAANPILMNFVGLRGAVINFNGAKLISGYNSSVTGGVKTAFNFDDCWGVTINDYNFDAASVGNQELGPGVWHVKITNGSKFFRINNLYAKYGTIGIGCARVFASATPRSSYIFFSGECYEVAYCLSFQQDGDHVAGRMKGYHQARGYFPYGVHDHDIVLESTQSTANDVLITAIGGGTIQESSTTGIRLKYTNKLSSRVGGAIAIVLKQISATAGNAYVQADIDLDVVCPSGAPDGGLPFFIMNSYLYGDVPGDAVNFIDLRLTGTIQGNNLAANPYSTIDFCNPASGFGDLTTANIVIENLVMPFGTGKISYGTGLQCHYKVVGLYAPYATRYLTGTPRPTTLTEFNAYYSDYQATYAIDNRVTVSDADYTIKVTDYEVALTAATAARTWTLPPANTTKPGQRFLLIDESGSVATFPLSVAPSGSDLTQGTNTTKVVINSALGFAEFASNGIDRYTLIRSNASSPLASATTGTGAAVRATSPTIATPTITGLLTSGGQIGFPATQAAAAGLNTLDDYEEGQGGWTPTITFATPGDLSVTYTTRLGSYIKIGRMVLAWFQITTSAFTYTTASGNFQITGLPFASDNAVNLIDWCGILMAWRGITKAGYTQIGIRLSAGTTVGLLIASASGSATSSVTATDVPTGGTIALTGVALYMANA